MKFLCIILLFLSWAAQAQEFSLNTEFKKAGINNTYQLPKEEFKKMSRQFYDNAPALNSKELRSAVGHFYYSKDFEYAYKVSIKLFASLNRDIDALAQVLKEDSLYTRYDIKLLAESSCRTGNYATAIKAVSALEKVKRKPGRCGTAAIEEDFLIREVKAITFNGLGRYNESYEIVFPGLFDSTLDLSKTRNLSPMTSYLKDTQMKKSRSL